MARDFTRREIAAAMMTPVPLMAQSGAAQPKDPLAEARDQIRSAITRMEKIELDGSVEPAFVFKP